ncbi:long-subunit fatty acid transport protein [Rhodovulum sulfidophilum]|uniref:outer membrane protein transport protein n=1 Tax=Rhodovulum sulfidophilum TaxID=35806 RepID=UPI0005A94DA3|nr:hypothetical protein [Rhodovulum sulfidophilum]ANB34821.1 hypothetical protein A6W98_12555 [Rhodovulum sulfidophilum DSM 1374]ANB38644.1 hypothetical protein A6024_12420 [Rhodovulum sulfidophilum]MCW2302133.1 long-subunit fatty acid transport protein [Rhodovulum sulfidophilum]
MKYAVGAAALAAVTTGPALAGGIERSVPSVGILFEQGNYVELGFSRFDPDVSGSVAGVFPSGEMAPGFNSYSFAYKGQFGENLHFALILDEPIGADIAYPAGTGYPSLAGASADVDALGTTLMMRYEIPSNFSVIGGVRSLRTSGSVDLPQVASYRLDSSTETDFGYLIGVAWEKPEIAARVALTYYSSITHDFTADESFTYPGLTPGKTSLETEIPKAVNLEFQTGIAMDTLLFGSIRWTEWSSFRITTPDYEAIVGRPIVSYDEDVITYNLGVGRKFNEHWSGAVLLGYERHEGNFKGNLGPTDGFRSLGLAATYTSGQFKITGGVRYVEIGDAKTRLGSNPTRFDGNDGVGFGLRVGYYF